MNRLIPHRTVYLHKAEALQQDDAIQQVDTLLAQFRQHDTGGCAVVEDPPRATLGEILLIPAWVLLGMAGLVACCLMWGAK